ncbi:MAG: 2-oxoglutarate dehydrogenase E1 component, partial [Myxococcota bacterium]|nr:2-oxoglutarate dehydrogenase E1 component [Myxococcota bacterium]
AETLNLSQLPGYRTGGTVHLIINNQIGFTTTPGEGRSTPYCSDVAKMVEAPVFHVNGDDPESVVHAVELALRFRQEFGGDAVVDVVCYRRHGHNEADEPAYTQPLMYDQIKRHPSVRALYTRQLLAGGAIDEGEARSIAAASKEELQGALEAVRGLHPKPLDTTVPFNAWEGLTRPYDSEAVETGVPRERLLAVARALTTVPDGFSVHRKIGRALPSRLKAAEGDGPVDWALAESMAFGSLLLDGFPVRLSGQDSARGTFSHRHSVWTDTRTQATYTPLNHIDDGQAAYCVHNSLLSEAAVLGFEYGYSLDEPRMLNLWEAQFGDFANGAQVIIDQFLTSSGDKWQRYSGLVMLLPHSSEGQGPEHSNAYLERYLAACADDNIQVCNVTTPAQYFHLLRRQLFRPFRRPLVLMAPKSLLRHREVVSPMAELESGHFREILDDPEPPETARRLVLCSGKVYYELAWARREQGVEDVALVRLEQIFPLCDWRMAEIAARYAGAEQVIWAQEETANRGAWSFVHPWLRSIFLGIPVRYVGRDAAASPATGSMRVHRREQEQIIRGALGSGPTDADP